MDIPEQLIIRFFEKKCTAEQAAMVSSYLKDNPGILNKYLSKEEWDGVEDPELPEGFWDQSWIRAEQREQAGRLRVMRLKRVAVAASIIGIIATCSYFLIKSSGPAVNTGNSSIVSGLTRKKVSNSLSSVMHLVLQDGSKVDLSPQSTLEYYEPFKADERDVYLSGEALFTVTGNSLQPFRVYTREIATTALGTSFRVQSYDYSRTILVRLYSGKVEVNRKSANADSSNRAQLLPGYELLYSSSTLAMTVRLFLQPNKPRVAIKNNTPVPAGYLSISPSWYRFDNQELKEVFDNLALIYDTKITYPSNELKLMYFIGKFDKTDSLEQILQTICSMNDLQVKKTSGGTYNITKSLTKP